jgi:hypothetical protein
MQILDQAVAVMRKRGANGPQVAAKLEALAAVSDEAARIWQGYLDRPGAPGDKYTLVSWMGPDRARQLFELSLKAKTLVDDVCAAAGPTARLLVLDESPVVMAYAGLAEGETGPQAAALRLAAQQAMGKHLRALADAVRPLKAGGGKTTAAKAKRPAAGKAAAKKKPAAKKKVPKKAVKKAAKKPAKKAPNKK